MGSHPEILRRIHADYIDAGAEIHIVNSFALARHVLEPAGYGDQVEIFNRRAVELCREAIATAGTGRRHWIAGSLSTFSDKSDRSRLPQRAGLRANYDEQAAILSAAGVDLFAEVKPGPGGVMRVVTTQNWSTLPPAGRQSYANTLLDRWAAAKESAGPVVLQIVDPDGEVLMEKSQP